MANNSFPVFNTAHASTRTLLGTELPRLSPQGHGPIGPASPTISPYVPADTTIFIVSTEDTEAQRDCMPQPPSWQVAEPGLTASSKSQAPVHASIALNLSRELQSAGDHAS